MKKITRQEVLGLNDLVGTLPKDIKDFEYQYCLIENSERLAAAVTKIKDALKSAADEKFLTMSTEISETASGFMKEDSSANAWPAAMDKALKKLPKKKRDEYLVLQKEQAKLEIEYLGKEADIELYKIGKDELPKPFPLDQTQTIAFKYFIK